MLRRACQVVPRSLAEATERFTQSEFAKEAFGEAVVEHYTHHFTQEFECLQSGRYRLGTEKIFRTNLIQAEHAFTQ